MNEAARDAVAGAVTQDDAATAIERGEDDLAGFTLADGEAGFRIDDLDDAEIGLTGAQANAARVTTTPYRERKSVAPA